MNLLPLDVESRLLSRPRWFADDAIGMASHRFLIPATAFGLVASLFFTFWISIGAPLDHDEYQHVAAAALLARDGLLPYHSYGYFHMPNLVFVNALVFKLTGHLLLGARLLSMICGWLVMLTTAAIAYRLIRRVQPVLALPVAVVVGLFVLFNPIFLATTGRAHNHDLSLLLALGATACLLRLGERSRRPLTWIGVAGFLAGLSLGTRLTFAPMLLAMLLTIWIAPSPRATRLRGIGLFCLAATVALLPAIILFAIAPKQAIFGNLVYPRLNTFFRELNGYRRAMSAFSKSTYVLAVVVRGFGTFLLLTALVAASLVRRNQGRLAHGSASADFERRALLLLLIGALAGSFLPTPLFLEYFYAPVPYAVLLLAATTARIRAPMVWRLARFEAALCLLCIISAAMNLREKARTAEVTLPFTWPANVVHDLGGQIARRVGTGRVLTLMPIFPLEGKLQIYPELATGPFSERAAAQLGEGDEDLQHVMDLDDFAELLQTHAPAAVLTGLESTTDAKVGALAARYGYRAELIPFNTKWLTLYVRPAPAK